MLTTILGFVRHTLTFGGGFLAADGVATNDEIQTAISALVTVAGFAWSVFDKYKNKKGE